MKNESVEKQWTVTFLNGSMLMIAIRRITNTIMAYMQDIADKAKPKIAMSSGRISNINAENQRKSKVSDSVPSL